MKLLFISIRDVVRKNSGGEKCTNRNYLSFCELLGKENVEVINISSFHDPDFLSSIARRLTIFSGYYAGLSIRTKNLILERSRGFDHIFIDASYLGIIAYHLKKAGFKGKIISFFHNVEVSVMRQKARINLFDSWKIFPVRFNEKKAVACSDKLVVLNARDYNELKRIYHAGDAQIIPISLPDEYMPAQEGLTQFPPTFLFIGDNWFPNIHGLRWFTRNVLDHVDIHLLIAGRNMERYKAELSHPKIELLGFVDDLSPVIRKADYFLCPVFIGGGMKVKVCEALMYGKHIVGTTEAFEGYQVDYQSVGALCNSSREFIDTIRSLSARSRDKFNGKSREYFLESYSFRATLDLFRQLLG